MAPAGELSADTLEQLFQTHIAADLGRYQAVAVARPQLVVIGGQPGSGKSSGAYRYIQKFHDQGGLVPIIGDDYRRFHPQFLDVLTTDDTNLAGTTGPAALWWVQAASAWCLDRRVNLLIEATLRDGEQSFNPTVAARFAGAGYQINVISLAVPALISRLGIVHRYVQQRQVAGGALWTTLEAHDRAFRSLPATLGALGRNPDIGRIVVRTRTEELAARPPGPALDHQAHLSPPGGIVEALQRVHNTPPGPDQHADLAAHWHRIKGELTDTGRADHPAVAPLVNAIDLDLEQGARRDRPALRSHRLPPQTELQQPS
ncbi:MAG: zeta toxin family protein [Acidimicrobiales bacterium]